MAHWNGSRDVEFNNTCPVRSPKEHRCAKNEHHRGLCMNFNVYAAWTENGWDCADVKDPVTGEIRLDESAA